MFAWLVVPLLQALKWINGFVGNYGWSIVVLTVLINLAIFPLRHRSMVSMRKMQALQPEIKAIQDRYAKYKLTDPERQKMNQEMMALYKQKGVNPASGCVPMLLTMPVLFAFYAMLAAAIELRGAPFFGWITRPVEDARSVLRHAGAHGRDDVLAAEDDADDGRSGAAEDVHVDAGHLHGHVPVGAGGPRHLLAGEQHHGDRPAVLHQPDHRRAAGAAGARDAAGGSADKGKKDDHDAQISTPRYRLRPAGDRRHGARPRRSSRGDAGQHPAEPHRRRRRGAAAAARAKRSTRCR